MMKLTNLIVILPSATAFIVQNNILSPCFLKPAYHDSPQIIPGKSSRESNLPLLMSYYSDSADYKSTDADYSPDDDPEDKYGVPITNEEGEDSPSIELSPVPMSKNSGNRFVAFVFDRHLTSLASEEEPELLEMHENRIAQTEEHVMFCRKNNLYNETFNTESMADILWSHQILSSDMVRTVGHVLCIESTTVEYAKDVLSRDPIVQRLTGGDVSNMPFYRWRHIKDPYLRQDDGRTGGTSLLLALDRSAEEGVGNLREKGSNDHLEYLIRSERVIASGPLHLCTEFKDDPSSIALGNLVLFNTETREDAINFVENDPLAKAGLYSSMRVFAYNSLDITGKFVSQDLVYEEGNEVTSDMKDIMEHWGYPVDDLQTPWLNC